jgi:DNA-binding response OmpR family regulator
MMRTIDPSSCIIDFGTGTLHLTKTQFSIVFALFRAKGRVLTPTFLAQVIEDASGRESESRVLETHLVAIRKKLAPFGMKIINHHSIGYSLSAWDFEVLREIEEEIAA